MVQGYQMSSYNQKATSENLILFPTPEYLRDIEKNIFDIMLKLRKTISKLLLANKKCIALLWVTKY